MNQLDQLQEGHTKVGVLSGTDGEHSLAGIEGA
jgi:hypothetical protein